MERPAYFCGPPVAQQTISVTRYLNPGRGHAMVQELLRRSALEAELTRHSQSLVSGAPIDQRQAKGGGSGFSHAKI
jgi:hypothetical protein